MIISVAMLSVYKEHQDKVIKILEDIIAKEKNVPGCAKAYYKRAINNDDTFLVYAEYDTMEHFQAAEKTAMLVPEGQKPEFILRPYLMKGFFGNFE
jgi:quinol monooxygenase YgiN